MEKKISVIVPIYNVEKFLEKCVESIINQTYQNLEIILVDDGSPDNCGKICDKYAKIDARIKVIHKENGGLSDARNAGIKVAKGDYISFIDSDDWIDNDLYEKIMNENKEYDADIITFGIYIDYDNGKTIIKTPNKKEIIDNKTGIIYLNTYKNIDISACNKLYKKELFEKIEFPVGKICEDYYIMYKIFDLSKKILVLPYSKYHYFQRVNSITKNNKINMDYIYASKEQMEYIIDKYPELKNVVITNYAYSHVAIYNIKAKRGLLKSKNDRKNEIKPLKKYLKNVLENKYLPIKKKLQYVLFSYINELYYIIIK